MTTKQLFEEILPRILRDNPERAQELGGAIAFHLGGQGGGIWTIDPTAQPPRVVAGPGTGAVCTVTAQAVDFEAMLEEPKAALRLYQEGKIQVTGNTILATHFHRLFR
jgi:hypothetical protein